MAAIPSRSGWDLLEKLYIPALSGAVPYQRCCAYFSSSVLSAAAQGFGNLIQHLIENGENAPKPAVRLIVNEQLSRKMSMRYYREGIVLLSKDYC